MPQIPFFKSEVEDTIPSRFRRVAGLVSENIAIETESERISYSDLDKISDQIACVILRHQVPQQFLYAILMEHGVMALATILGVLKAGKSFIIAPPETPAKRLSAFFEDALQPLVLTNSENHKIASQIALSEKIINIDTALSSQESFDPPAVNFQPDDMAAIFYTSGTTGEPKGVIWSHELILHTAFLNCQSYQISPKDRLAMLSAFGFGAAMTMSFAALLSGATLLIPNMLQLDLLRFIRWAGENKVTILSMPPVDLFRQLVTALVKESPLSNVRLIILGGDTLYARDVDLYKRSFNKDTVLVYRLAGSETMLMREHKITTSMEFSTEKISVGNSIPDKDLLLLDEYGQMVPEGTVGEIAIQSRYLSPGYWRNPELTAKSFLPDPNGNNKRIYLTGDTGILNANGELEYLGRKDQMVKIRGYSVQLETIDQALQKLDNIQDAVVIVQPVRNLKRLVAYLVSSGERKPSVNELRDALSAQLPGYMIPSSYIWLDRLPRTVTGKIDRKELPPPTLSRPDLGTVFVPPRTDLEEKIASIWKNILELEKVGIEDNFFELGGDSLSTLEMTLDVERLLSKNIPTAFFKSPTISSLTALIESDHEERANRKKFAVESYKKDSRESEIPKTRKFKAPRLKSLLTRKYSLDDFDKLLDLLVARHIISMPYLSAKQWTVAWSQNRFVQNMLYRRRYSTLTQWMATLRNCHAQPSDVFQMSVLTNMNFGLSRYLGKKERSGKTELQNYKRSRHPFWRTLGEMLDAVPVGQLNEHFPISGLDRFYQAYDQGKGVILLTFHGVPTPSRFFALERYLGLEDIPTISYHILRWQSQYYNKEEQLTDAVASTLNAEIALFGQRKLLEGKVINLASDTNDMQGRTYQTPVAGRVYQIKGGFAELALNTGAKIIPHFRHCLQDGSIQLSFGQQLEPGSGDRSKQVENLINGYASFIESTWAAHPEAMRWIKIRRHLSRPLSTAQP